MWSPGRALRSWRQRSPGDCSSNCQNLWCPRDSQGKLKYLLERSEKLRWKIQSKFGRYTVAPGDVPGIDIVPHERIYSVLSGLLKALAHYWPSKPLDCQIVVVGSTAPLEWVGAVLDDPCHGWSAWTTKPVKLYQIDAPHTQLFRDDYIEQVARDMREVIETAKAEEGLCGPSLSTGA
jgi:hypothetical protein